MINAVLLINFKQKDFPLGIINSPTNIKPVIIENSISVDNLNAKSQLKQIQDIFK